MTYLQEVFSSKSECSLDNGLALYDNKLRQPARQGQTKEINLPAQPRQGGSSGIDETAPPAAAKRTWLEDEPRTDQAAKRRRTDGPEPAPGCALHDDPLLEARLTVRDGHSVPDGLGVCWPFGVVFEALLILHLGLRFVVTFRRSPMEYGWEALLGILAAQGVQFAKSADTLRFSPFHSEHVLWAGNVD
ncbi:hypothetical protein CTA1_10626 [Colletotrichum tanaceti]|uniref:Uncharacterized protein n=1 Tax=Colletotrichum tanaceti TaxID=1306861 RepID=A0A4U6XLK6_9PEZI|nr:hypothetical protein CTA1_10626 [Colletotrichum tanaceti]